MIVLDFEDFKFNLDFEFNYLNGEEIDSDIDEEYIIFFILLEKVDDVCIWLNSLIKNG